MSFKPDQIYFRVTYPDSRLMYPCIETFVFLGENLVEGDQEPTWYFQPARDFGRYGSAMDPGASERPVVCLTQDNPGDMCTLEELVQLIQDADVRRASKKAT